jgi:hypothetical protein
MRHGVARHHGPGAGCHQLLIGRAYEQGMNAQAYRGGQPGPAQVLHGGYHGARGGNNVIYHYRRVVLKAGYIRRGYFHASVAVALFVEHEVGATGLPGYGRYPLLAFTVGAY